VRPVSCSAKPSSLLLVELDAHIVVCNLPDLMDVWQTTFKGMYKAVSILSGVAAHASAGVPGLFSVLFRGATPAAVLPGTMTGLSMASFTLNFHSAHALVLFNALRAEGKYSDKREQLRAIQDAMDKFIKVIEQATGESSPIPSGLPEADAVVLFDPPRYAAFMKQANEAINNTKAFVQALDLVLDDVARCLEEWNKFLRGLRKFLESDKPRNVFEALSHYSLHNERDWAWYKDETGFSSACNQLLTHRNKWAALIDLGPRGDLPRLSFDRE
jgi:hypothetical protein